MNPAPRHAFPLRPYLGAGGVCLLQMLLSLPLRGRVDLANVALLAVLAVVLASARWGRGPGVFAAIVAVAGFDLLFVPPQLSFTVADVQYLIIFAVMLAVSLVISHLTNAYRDKAVEAEQRAAEAALLHELASALSGALDNAQVAARLQAVVARHLHVQARLWLPDLAETLQACASGADTSPPAADASTDAEAAARRVHASGNGCDAGPCRLERLRGSTRPRGVLALCAAPGAAAPAARLVQAVAAVVTTAVERIHFVEVAQQRSLEVREERLRNTLLSAISHDLRTPLTVLHGLADALAQDRGLPAEQQAAAAALCRHSHQLHRQVENLLDLARLHSGRIELRRDWQSLPDLAGACVQAMAPWLEPRPIRIAMPADLPLVELDALLMERVFCNLLENAAKYSPPHSPIVFAAAAEAGPPAQLVVWVDNDGAGFPAGALERVFLPFERGQTEATPGTGIGLALCRSIVETHGGRIEALNRPAGGARVRLQLPLGEAPALPEDSEDAAAPGSAP